MCWLILFICVVFVCFLFLKGGDSVGRHGHPRITYSDRMSIYRNGSSSSSSSSSPIVGANKLSPASAHYSLLIFQIFTSLYFCFSSSSSLQQFVFFFFCFFIFTDVRGEIGVSTFVWNKKNLYNTQPKCVVGFSAAGEKKRKQQQPAAAAAAGALQGK